MLMQASHQWMSRPADERFTSLTDMLKYKLAVRENSISKVVPTRSIEAVSDTKDSRAMTILGPNGVPLAPTNWSFGQLSSLVKAPAAYLRGLPAPLAADCINYGLAARDVEDVGVLVRKDEDGGQLTAITGPNYGRVWDATIVQALVNRFGDGLTGDFKVPGEFGKDVIVTKENTTLYASDRDMFVFLADEKHKIEVPGRRDGQPGLLSRGFFVWNSEVGNTTFGVATFLFDYVCCNRIVWGPQEYREIKLRHTSSAPDRWIEEVAPAVEAYANSSARNIEDAVRQAKAKRIETDVTDFLKNRRQFSGRQIGAIISTHLAEENRPIETVWDAATAVTAYARGLTHQDQRVELEREAGKILDLAA